MKLEQQVVSLELAQKLKELGVKQESLFAYSSLEMINFKEGTAEIESRTPITKIRLVSDYDWTGDLVWIASAYTVAELGEMLPATVKTIKDNGDICCYHRMNISRKTRGYMFSNPWVIQYNSYGQDRNKSCTKGCGQIAFMTEETLADTLALELIYLAEHSLINPTELK